ncbi:hypothetical protein D3C79_34660 [compost metagenome]
MKKILSGLILSSLIAGNVYADPSYRMQVPLEVMGIKGGDSTGDGDGGGGTEPSVPEANPGGWLAYFQSKNYLTELTDFKQWDDYYSEDYAQIDDVGHPDAEMPTGSFGLSQIGELGIEDPYITNVSFLTGVKAAYGLYFYNTAGLVDISGLRSLEKVNELGLIGTGVSNISALSSLRSANSLSFNNSPVVNINPIKNLADVKEIAMDYNKNTFGPLLPLTSPLCQAFIKNDVRITVIDKNKNNMSRGARTAEICESAKEEWIIFLHNFGKHLNEVSIESVAAQNSLDMDFSAGDFGNTVTIQDGDIPSAPYPAILSGSSMWATITSTKLTNVDFLSTAKAFQRVDLSNNALLKNLNGLSNVTEVSMLVLANTPELTDISGLANIARTTSSFMGAGEISVDHLLFTKRPAIGSPFCQGMQSGLVNVQLKRTDGNSTWYEKAVYGSLCY